ncbi:MMPL family transporter, partial [bacterium]|nr:MMPL family transporter [bacterium]
MTPTERLLRFHRLLLRRRYRVWTLTLALVAFCAWSARGLVWRENIVDLLPSRDPLVSEHLEWMERFRPLDRMFFVAGPEDPANPPDFDQLVAVTDALAEELREAPDGLIEDVTYRFDPGQARGVLEFARNHRAALFTEAREREMETSLAPESIEAGLRQWRRILTEMPAPYLADIFRRDPLGMDRAFLVNLRASQAFGGPVRVEKGRLVSRDGRNILILARPGIPSTDSRRAGEMVDFVESAIEKAEEKAGCDGVEVAWLAGHRFGLENSRQIKRDLKMTVTLSAIGIAILALLAFSKFVYAALALLPAVFGAVFAMGLVRWFEPDISAIAIGCGSMLVGIAVDYGIHILFHADQEEDSAERAERIARVLNRLTRPLLLGAGTTLAAFLVLRLSILPGNRDLALFAVLGIGGAAAFALLVLPSLLTLFGGKSRRRPVLDLTRAYPAFVSWTAQRRKLLAGLILILTLLALAGLPRVRLEGDYQKLNAASPETRHDWDKVLETFGDTLETTPVAVRGQDLSQALARNAELAAALEILKQEGLVQSFNGIAALFPTSGQQTANIDRWLAFWSEDRVRALRENLRAASADLQIKPQVFEPFLDALRTETERIDPTAPGNPLFSEIRDIHMSIGPHDTLVLTNVRFENKKAYARSLERLRPDFPGLISADGETFMEHLVAMIYRELERMGLFAMGAVVVLLLVTMRSLRRGGILLLPLLFSAIWTFGILGWLEIRINMMNSIVVIFIFG